MACKKTDSKKSNHIYLMILIALILVGGLATGGVFLYRHFNTAEGKIATERYVVVPYTENGFSTKLKAKPMAFTSLDNTSTDTAVKLCQWSDGEYTYYQYYVGYVKNVPISYETPCFYDGGSLKLTFSKSTVNEESVEKSLSTCKEVTKSESQTASASVTLSAEKDFTFAKFSVEASVGWEGTWSESTSLSTSDTYTTAQSFAEETSYSVEYTINGKTGYYRYTLFATTDVYAIARTKDTKSFEVDYSYCARPQTYNYAVDYTVDGDFEKSTSSNKLELRAESLVGLSLSDEVKPASPATTLVGTYSYNSSTDASFSSNRVVDDEGTFGMPTQYDNSDNLDMSSFKAYQSNAFVFEYVFQLSVTEKNDGYQEFYLYNNFNSGDETNSSYSQLAAQNHGLVAIMTDIDTTPENCVHEIVFRVPGSAVNDTMYTKFGAHGEDEDDWIVANVKCELNVYRATVQTLCNQEKKLENTKYYGQASTQTADSIDLSAYSEYFNSDNKFILTFAVTMKEADNGEQEMYLYTNNTISSDSKKYSDAVTNGLIAIITGVDENNYWYNYGDQSKDDKYSVVYFSVVVDGSKMLDTMYLRYDASGSWYVNNVMMYTTVLAN